MNHMWNVFGGGGTGLYFLWWAINLSVIMSTFYFNPHPANVDNMAAPTNASKWRMGFNSAFKGLKCQA
jgi:hypothetical protein